MLELIGTIVLVYYLVLGVALLVFLTWGFIDDHRLGKRRRGDIGNGYETQSQHTREPECAPPREVKQNVRLPDNVVRLKRRK